MNTTDNFTLTYTYWEDEIIVNAMAKEFMTLYPNITVENTMFAVGSNNEELLALSAAQNLPDVFWFLGSCDFAIENGMLYDMTVLWEADPDTDNLVPGIETLKLGYFGTDCKWATPVKYFPSAAFVNLNLFTKENKQMPDMDWTWEEMMDTIYSMTYTNTDNKRLFGITEGITVITWYPIASDKDCIGEFGWDGEKFDLTNWAVGMNLEAKLINEEYKGPTGWDTEFGMEIYGVGTPCQDLGYSAMDTDNWWTWERYWMTDEYVNNGIYYVPYAMPHLAELNGEGNYIATMDFGGMSAATQHPREAYELLKFMTWGAEGWSYKIDLYPGLYDDVNQRYIEKNNMPICNDDTIWEAFKAWHPGADDQYNRGAYFDYFLDICKNAVWCSYGGPQIPGFSTWLDEQYNGTFAVESAVINDKKDANDYVDDLTDLANQANQKRLQEIEDLLMSN